MASSDPSHVKPNPNQDRLATLFKDHDPSSHPSLWEALWNAGDFLPWDRGFPNPALYDALVDNPDIFGSPLRNDSSGKRKIALVPGCGRGYDVELLSAWGYDAYGVEYSKQAELAAGMWLLEQANNHRRGAEREEWYRTRDESVGRGVAKVFFGDYFADDWKKLIEGEVEDGFDLIYDCTFLSALPPSLRPPWASRTAELLAPVGHLICLEFPTKKPPKSGGPPYSLPPVVYEQLFARPGDEIEYDSEGVVVQRNEGKENEKALLKIKHWQPKRTHEVGKGTDWVSIWKHK